MRKINNLIIHCSDSNWGCEEWIDKWHKEKGFGNPNSPYLNSTGYHYVILNGKPHPRMKYQSFIDGQIEIGRPLDDDMFISLGERSAHTLGYNHSSIGVCLIGRNKFTRKQFISLWNIILYSVENYKISVENILGHYETPKAKLIKKTCPNFKVDFIRDGLKSFFKLNQTNIYHGFRNRILGL